MIQLKRWIKSKLMNICLQNVVESTGSDSINLYSNGFKLKSTDSGNNASW